MSLTITQANELNTLLDWITGSCAGDGQVPTEERARDAAAFLADHAHRALGAGVTPDRLMAAWPVPIGVCALCPTRVPAAELVPHIGAEHPGVLGETVDGLPVVDVDAAPARAAVSDFRDRVEHLAVAEPTAFDWDAVKVGDQDPTEGEPYCETDVSAASGTWWCTRYVGHSGRCVAGDGFTVVAVGNA